MKRLIFLLALLAVLMPSALLAAPVDPDAGGVGVAGSQPEFDRNHTSTYFRFYGSSSVYFPNFTINNGVTHYWRQTAPNSRCFHRIYRVSDSVVLWSGWLDANGPDPNTGGLHNGSGSSLYVSHTAYCSVNNVNVGVDYSHG